MPDRKASAVWQGTLKEGNGTMKMTSGAYEGPYSFASRFEEGKGTNPEELIAAAHAGCFSMALSGQLNNNGFTPDRIETTANVHMEKTDAGNTITRIDLVTQAKVPGIDDAKFQELAQNAKKGCPISRALGAVNEITLDAKLV
jgi:osmotically inducible protein OsmC